MLLHDSYWDWSADSQAPEKSPIWGSAAFGGNGCFSASAMGGALFSYVPNYHRVCRSFKSAKASSEDTGMESGALMGAAYSPFQISYLMYQKDYDSFRQYLEGVPHNMVYSNCS